jgi:hypothetical protein
MIHGIGMTSGTKRDDLQDPRVFGWANPTPGDKIYVRISRDPRLWIIYVKRENAKR